MITTAKFHILFSILMQAIHLGILTHEKKQKKNNNKFNPSQWIINYWSGVNIFAIWHNETYVYYYNHVK